MQAKENWLAALIWPIDGWGIYMNMAIKSTVSLIDDDEILGKVRTSL